mgnify:CR=1 FL=1
MSEKAVKQLRAELKKREEYWCDWNGRAANNAAKLEAQIAELREELFQTTADLETAQAQLDAVRGLLNTEYAERKDACNDSECEICIEWFAMISKLQAALNGED